MEVLLSVGVVGMIVLGASQLLQTVMEARVKQESVLEVEQQGAQAMRMILQTIRNADAVSSPAAGSSASSLILMIASSTRSPTVYDLSDDAIRIKEGSASVIPLTSPRVAATGLLFFNLSRSGTPGNVRVFFTLTRSGNILRHEYAVTKNFVGTASLR